MDAPRRHKVSVHVLAREMDSCKYWIVTLKTLCFNLILNHMMADSYDSHSPYRTPESEDLNKRT